MSAKMLRKTPLQLLFAFGSSFGLSCTLLLFLFLLTFLGTIEQAEHGLYDVQKKYFESAFLVHWLFGSVPIPLPGAYLLMVILACNLTLGGLVKIRKRKATVGVMVIHVGIIVLLLAGFVKLKFSEDGFLTLYEEGRAPALMTSSDEFQSYHEWEIVIFDGAQPKDVKELIIPDEEFLFLPQDFTRTFVALYREQFFAQAS